MELVILETYHLNVLSMFRQQFLPICRLHAVVWEIYSGLISQKVITFVELRSSHKSHLLTSFSKEIFLQWILRAITCKPRKTGHTCIISTVV